MSTSVQRFAFATLLPICILAPGQALAGYREETHATSIEIAQLPQFCLAQFEVPGAEGNEFKITNCGWSMNHYCPGLIYFIRGRTSTNKAAAVSNLQHADVDVAYTERGMADYPNCPIRKHVQDTREELNRLLRLRGLKPMAGK